MATRILIIEDNPANLDLMVYLLNHFGYTTITTMDGEDGFAIAAKENPDLIICDIQLPKLNGYEIAEKLIQDPKLSKIPLIAVTAFSMVGDRDKILASGFDDYMAKPIDPENFVKKIENLLKTHQKLNQEKKRD